MYLECSLLTWNDEVIKVFHEFLDQLMCLLHAAASFAEGGGVA